jgi:uncharacterized protein with HEPN domain
MRRELLLLERMAEAAEQAQRLVDGVSVHLLADDRVRRDAPLWNVTILGEAASQLPDEFKARFPEVPWQQPARLRNRIVHGYWLADLTFCTRRHSPACRASRQRCIVSWRF